MGDEETRRVALYDFNAVDWPFPRQQPLEFRTGQVIQVLVDDGSDWALGHLEGQPEVKGYFPKNYTVSVEEYQQMMEEYQVSGSVSEEAASQRPSVRPVSGTSIMGSEAASSPALGRPVSGMSGFVSEAPSESTMRPGQPWTESARTSEPDLGGDVHSHFGAESASPDTRAIRPIEEEDEEGDDDEDEEEEDDFEQDDVSPELQRRQDYRDRTRRQGDSGTSTPVTELAQKENTSIIKRHLPMELQKQFLRNVNHLANVVRRHIKATPYPHVWFPIEARARCTTIRMATCIEPPHLRLSLHRAQGSAAKWVQMFRPSFNDVVNETFKMGCNPCALSRLYLSDKQAREQFQRMHIRDTNGTLWFELQRELTSLYYQRVDFVDVMMHHPDAWGFPDAGNMVSANPGEPIDPFHGWCCTPKMATEREVQEEIEFLYTCRVRSFSELTFNTLKLGVVPEWMQPQLNVVAKALEIDASQPDPLPEDEMHPDAVLTKKAKKTLVVNEDHLLEAGMAGAEDIFMKYEEIMGRRNCEAGPDSLLSNMVQYTTTGLGAIRIFMRSRMNPDNMKQIPISPKMVKDMAAQLGIFKQPSLYWYCMFALRFPLSQEWEVVNRSDTRWYMHLPSGTVRAIHPMIRRFQEHLDECRQNDFLWDFRSSVKMKCSECALPDSVVWCSQCTDYFCAACFLSSHKSTRGKKHWPMPISGCRYLTEGEAARFSEHIPLLNVGFSNRRRFLARDNQSDKHGSRNGDTWLYFPAESFQSALSQAPQRHWYLKFKDPPQLPPGVTGYYYDFQLEILADDSSQILTKAEQQVAQSKIQKNVRGSVVRQMVKRWDKAALTIQKTYAMSCVLKHFKKKAEQGQTARRWYFLYTAQGKRQWLTRCITHFQAMFRGVKVRQQLRQRHNTIAKLQAFWRGVVCRRQMKVYLSVGALIQRVYRGHLYGRRPVKEMHLHAAKIQAMCRGVDRRVRDKQRHLAAIAIQCHIRGLWGRKRAKRMVRSAIQIQRNWRRFQSQIDVKLIIYERLDVLQRRYQEILQTKFETEAAVMVQRNYRRHRDLQRTVQKRREKTEADKRITTLLAAIYTATGSLRHHVHPWWRHLPPEIQEVLSQVKGSMQRTISLLPATGKLASEEIGLKGLRVASAKNMQYDNCPEDLASHMLVLVSKQLISHVPEELVASTLQWAYYSVGHQMVALSDTQGFVPLGDFQIGKVHPGPHPRDTLNTLWDRVGSVKHHHDQIMSTSFESIPCLCLHNLSDQQRYVALTAQVLITMRHALDLPSLAAEDHLKFQGLDREAAEQLMEVLTYEMGLRNEPDWALKREWPWTHGTSAALALKISTHMKDKLFQSEEKSAGKGAKKDDKEAKGSPQREVKDVPKEKEKASAKKEAKGAKAKDTKSERSSDSPSHQGEPEAMIDGLVSIPVSPASLEEKLRKKKELFRVPVEDANTHLVKTIGHFNRQSLLRCVQQVGYLTTDLNLLLKAVSGVGSGGAGEMGASKLNRFLQVTNKLFDMADASMFDHCPFVVAVVLFHMVLRGVMLRVLYHRAAMTIQKRYRYRKTSGLKQYALRPAMCIQRIWRGLRAALRVMKMDDGARMIQRNFRAWVWQRRSAKMLKCTLRLVHLWRGAIQRKWIRTCHKAATHIQAHIRGHLIRVVLDKEGRNLAKGFKDEMDQLLKKRRTMSEGAFVAAAAALAGKTKVRMDKHRKTIINLRKMAACGPDAGLPFRSPKKPPGSIQPARLSVFEPMVFALRRLKVPPVAVDENGKPLKPHYASQSIILQETFKLRKLLERSIPPKLQAKAHMASRRGRAAVATRRIQKNFLLRGSKVLAHADESTAINEFQYDCWFARQFLRVAS